jgi:uncharacterized membrane protein
MRMLRSFVAASITLCATGALAATFPAPPLYPSFSSATAQFITIDAPGAVSTLAVAVNDRDEVTGYYKDNNGAYHGFIRQADGTFLKFDAPHAHSQMDTFVDDMNAGGDVVGTYGNTSGVSHGFVRKADGTITKFDPPNATQTNPFAINIKGEIAGGFTDANNARHGFLRARSGAITVVDYPGSTCDTGLLGINAAGIAVGQTCIGSTFHAFMRDGQGNFTIIDPPGAISASASAINASGTIIGEYADSNNMGHSFIRDPSGSFTIVDAQHPRKRKGATVTGINKAGVTVGFYGDGQAFIRSADGGVNVFKGPGSILPFPRGINAHRAVVGLYGTAGSNADHGFLRTQ